MIKFDSTSLDILKTLGYSWFAKEPLPQPKDDELNEYLLLHPFKSESDSILFLIEKQLPQTERLSFDVCFELANEVSGIKAFVLIP